MSVRAILHQHVDMHAKDSEYSAGCGLTLWQILAKFVNWGQQSFLQINVANTKETFIDFGRRTPPPALHPVWASGLSAAIQVGTVKEEKLSCNTYTDDLCHLYEVRVTPKVITSLPGPLHALDVEFGCSNEGERSVSSNRNRSSFLHLFMIHGVQ